MIQIDPKRIPKLQSIVANNSFKPALERILMTKTHIVASDAHKLVAFEIDSVFESVKELIKMIPKQGVQITKHAWIEMTKKTAVGIELFMGTIIIKHVVVRRKIPLYEYEVKLNTFPNNKASGLYPAWEKVFPEETKAVDSIGFNVKYLTAVLDLYPNPYQFKMTFHGGNKGVMIDFNDDFVKGKVLIMPCTVS